MTLSWGPQSLPHTQRLTIAHEIAERVKERFHRQVLAIGLFGKSRDEEKILNRLWAQFIAPLRFDP